MSSLQGLDGDNESYADTIRRFIERGVTITDVVFISEGGINQGRNTAREQELTSNDMKYHEKESSIFVRFYDGDIKEVATTNSFIYYEATVNIDIFGKHAHDVNRAQILRVRDQIDDLIFRNQRGPYKKSFENKNSAIIGFRNYLVEWIRIPETGNDGITESLHGELFCQLQRNLDD